MKTWKRNLLIGYTACGAIAVVVYFSLLYGSSMWAFFKFLLTLVGIGLIAGVGVCGYLVVYAFIHEHATLHAGPEGAINIERSALESTARRALAGVDGITVQRVAASVIGHRGEPVIDVSITAVPYGPSSLMATAGRIQSSVKRAVEAFTDHEVRYVAVNFVEPRRREEMKAAQASVDARAAEGYVPPRYTSDTAYRPSRDEKSSVWQRVKERVSARVEASRARKDEDVVETQAVVEDVVNDADDTDGGCFGDAPAESVACDGATAESVANGDTSGTMAAHDDSVTSESAVQSEVADEDETVREGESRVSAQ